jgi:hypothetical protein
MKAINGTGLNSNNNAAREANLGISERTTSVHFLDLTLTLDHRHIVTRPYEKPLNLDLYIRVHSAHPRGILNGMITGHITRVFHLTFTETDREASIHKFSVGSATEATHIML